MCYCCAVITHLQTLHSDNIRPIACSISIHYMLCGVPYYHGMACRQVADGGEGLQIGRVAANIFNKQSRTADEEWSSSLGV
jgi:hypothetical protein